MNKPIATIELVRTSLWLGFKVLSHRKITYTRCPKCKGLIRPKHGKPNPGPCPYCKNDKLSEEHENSYLALKFVGVGFIFCVIGTIVLVALGLEYQVCSHLSTALGGILAGAIGVTAGPMA